jgi:hypothetical protein
MLGSLQQTISTMKSPEMGPVMPMSKKLPKGGHRGSRVLRRQQAKSCLAAVYRLCSEVVTPRSPQYFGDWRASSLT